MPGDGLEMFDHHLGLLRDVVRMQLHEAGQRPRRLPALHVGIVLAGLEQPEVCLVGGVVPEHIEDEPFLDGLAHGVTVYRIAVAAEHNKGLVLRRGGEGEEAQVRLPAALGHAAEQLLHVFPAFLGRAFCGFFPQPLAAEHFLEIGGGLAALGAVRLVDDDGATTGGERPGAVCPPFLGHPEQVPGDERELLQGGDDDRHRALERLGELARVLVDALHDTALVLELVDRVLELLIEHDAVREHDHTVEDPLVVGVVQRREPMGEPSDGVALSAAGGVLDEVVVSRALPACGDHEQAHRLKLMVAGEDHGLRLDLVAPLVPLLFDLQVNEAGQDVEQTVALQHLLPQIGCAIAPAGGIGRIARRPRGSLVEGQELRCLAGQPGGHEHGVGVRSEVGQRAALEFEDRLARVAVPLILPASVLGALAGERILQLQRCHRDAVQAQREVERLLGARREMELAGEAQTVGGVAGLELGIQFVRCLEEGDPERAP